MRIAAAGLAVALTLPLAGDAMRRSVSVQLVAAVPIELRVAPDGGAPIRATLPAGATYEVTARQAHWIRLRSGEEWGWTIDERESGTAP
ncbi:MAG: SH3 domain-containing protein [Hansschlegelia sp.]